MLAPDHRHLGLSVSVGIPTYNRAATLPRAIESVLSQTHTDLELVISDNASSDRTREICERYASADPRVRYLCQPVNRGPTANFNTLFDECRGDCVLLLSDDDWLDLDYVERCLGELMRRDGHALVCGLARYYEGEEWVKDGVEMQLSQPSGSARVLAYFSKVRDNGTYYGLISRGALERAAPLLNVLANDWLLVAAIAYQGTISTLRGTAVNRSLGGTSKDTATTTVMLGKPTLQARAPHLIMAWHTFAQLGWRARAYDDLSVARRLVLAARCALLVIDWPSLAWHLTAPTMISLGRHRWGRPLASGYLAFTRRLGAGQQRYF